MRWSSLAISHQVLHGHKHSGVVGQAGDHFGGAFRLFVCDKDRFGKGQAAELGLGGPENFLLRRHDIQRALAGRRDVHLAAAVAHGAGWPA